MVWYRRRRLLSIVAFANLVLLIGLAAFMLATREQPPLISISIRDVDRALAQETRPAAREGILEAHRKFLEAAIARSKAQASRSRILAWSAIGLLAINSFGWVIVLGLTHRQPKARTSGSGFEVIVPDEANR